MRTGKGTPGNTCNSGVPSGMKITNRRFVVDPEIGAVVVLSRFSNNELPDSHLFRFERGKIHYTLTVCTIPAARSSDQPSRANREGLVHARRSRIDGCKPLYGKR